ncbi:Oxygen-insensitive NAD(P)H nitroreductase [Klebsiella pneumoniae]|uniref:Oxygen-insensitive NAD(P)H nitroreductase n=1 Tax=Klebsiella pneumoniae TaxID=573 RepID=A0A4P0XZQ1_KLEPN|nr:Oxygen-insensitive NAD(P)H nitroreductase [Klebsiella pneumoniae]
MDIVSVALKRYSTKAFDATKKLTAGEAEQLKTLLQYSRLAPTPSRGTLLSPAPMKGKLAWRKPPAAPTCSTNVKFSTPRTGVFCAKTAMDDAWLQRVVDQEEADGRFATPDAKAANHKVAPSLPICTAKS